MMRVLMLVGVVAAWSTPIAAETVTVKPGDSLSEIARRELGNTRRWLELCDLNKANLRTCDEIIVGTEIELPVEAIASDKPEAPVAAATPVLDEKDDTKAAQPATNLVQSSDFSSSYWEGYFYKPETVGGVADPEGGNSATRVESADKPGDPGLHMSGFLHSENVGPGTYRASVWLRSTSGKLSFRVGIADELQKAESVEINETWQRVEFELSTPVEVERLFQIVESTENNPAWEIFDVSVVKVGSGT